MTPRVLMIDNYDSFTYNLVQAFLTLGADVTVHRNDAITLEDAVSLPATHVVISPGPGAPEAAGISLDIVRVLAARLPILGVCLGHQAIVAALGGVVARAARPMHGKCSTIRHDGRGVFRGLAPEIEVGRYHSLVALEGTLPDDLEVSARTLDGQVMGVRHRTLRLEGVQFHPESVLTPEGGRLLENFLCQV